jgi:hypothetical protein
MEKIFTIPMINLKELISREIIRHDQAHEFLNKMNDEEIKLFYKEISEELYKKNIHGFPKRNVAILSRVIDTDMLYILIKNEGKENISF